MNGSSARGGQDFDLAAAKGISMCGADAGPFGVRRVAGLREASKRGIDPK